MKFSMKFNIVRSGLSIVYIEWSQVIISETYIFFLWGSIMANSADSDETSFYLSGYSFVVCQSTHLAVSGLHVDKE